MKTVYIIGYYNHYNLGDEQYKDSFKYLFPTDNLQFIDCDKLEDNTFAETDIIIFGGGDVLNSYFLPKINKMFANTKNTLYAISVGIPYINYVIENYKELEIFSRIYLRTKQDIDLLSNIYPRECIFYFPDISISLIPASLPNDSYKDRQNICVCVSRSIYDSEFVDQYNNCVIGLANTISHYIDLGYNIILIPSNTNINNPNEYDVLMQNDIYNLIPINQKPHINNIIETQNINDINTLFINSCLVITMRFHCCLFAIYNNVPLVPIVFTRKIQNLLRDINWNYKYDLDVNTQFVPINIDSKILIDKVDECLLEDTNNRHFLKEVNKSLFFDYYNIRQNIRQNLFLFNTSTATTNKSAYSKILSKKVLQIQEVLADFINCPLYEVVDKNTKILCTQIVSYYLTGYINSIYNYGLMDKMFVKNYNYNAEWGWVILNECKNKDKNYIPNDGLYSIVNHYQNINNTKVHRSGWQYITESIKQFNGNSKTLPLLDMYVDCTFHWNKDINHILGIIPYYKPWFGIIHHTFDETFSSFNNTTLFESQDFILSLMYCKGFIVLSQYLQKQLQQKLEDINYGFIPVHCLTHPTEFVSNLFTIKKFRQNKDKQLINVGAWMRNIYSFYKLPLTDSINPLCNLKSLYIKKSALKGLFMDNYFPYDDFLIKIQELLATDTGKTPSTSGSEEEVMISRGGEIHNNWYKHFYEDLKNMIDSVTIINYIDDLDYDSLLSQNIVFLNLVDASAVNTLLECVVRNTPIIVNKHPAVVEVLGEDYPMYYTTFENIELHISTLISYGNIEKTTNYLQSIDKKKFALQTFITGLKSIFM